MQTPIIYFLNWSKLNILHGPKRLSICLLYYQVNKSLSLHFTSKDATIHSLKKASVNIIKRSSVNDALKHIQVSLTLTTASKALTFLTTYYLGLFFRCGEFDVV